jgi:hypothetical protein
MITGCYFYSLENHLIDTTFFNSVTIPTNTYRISTLISVASSLVDHRSCWVPGLGNICGTIKNDLSHSYDIHLKFHSHNCVLRDEINKIRSHLHMFFN